MTVEQCIKKNGYQSEVKSIKLFSSVDISFVNSEGIDDETQFDVINVLTRSGIEELSELFDTFCKENGFKNNTVYALTIVKSASSLEDL